MQRFSAIDGLRFRMAWWVIADHIFLATGARRYVSPQVADFIEHGNWAVQLFMIISGFVITHVILSRKDTYQTYIIQRFFRLYPLYVVAMIAAISVRDWDASVWADSSYIADPLRAINRIASENTYPMLHAILHVTMFHGVVPDDRLALREQCFPAACLEPFGRVAILPCCALVAQGVDQTLALGLVFSSAGHRDVACHDLRILCLVAISVLPASSASLFYNRRRFATGYSSAAIDFGNHNIVGCLIYRWVLDKYLSLVRLFVGPDNLDILSCAISI